MEEISRGDAPSVDVVSSLTLDQHHHSQDRHQPEPGNWLCCVPCYWLRRNNSVHKASLTVATLLVMSLLVASPVIFLISSVPGSNERTRECLYQNEEGCTRDDLSSDHICRDESCRKAGARTLASMNWKTEPCHDFYRFACGAWGAGVDPPATAISFNTLQSRVDQQVQDLLIHSTNEGPFFKLGQFYDSCLKMRDKRAATAPMFALLDDLGGYLSPGSPLPLDNTALVTQLLLVNGAPLFDLYMDRDLTNRSVLAVYLDLPRRYGHTTRLLHRPRSDIELTESSYVKWQSSLPRTGDSRHRRGSSKESRAYTYMKDRAEEKRLMEIEELLRHFLPFNMPSELKAKEAHGILLFASMLSKLFPREKDIINRSQQTDVYKTFNISQLQQTYGFVEWRRVLEEVFTTNFTDAAVIYVAAPNYLASLHRLLSHFQPRVIHNALLVVYGRDILHELVNVTAAPDWPAFCSRVTVNVFSRAVSALYVRQYSHEYLEELRREVTQVFQRLKATLESRVRDLAWLDESTRATALKKLSSLKGQFSTWPQLWNQTYVDSLLEDVEIDPDNFFENVIKRYRQLRTAVPVDFQRQMPDEQKWAVPFLVNAFYEQTINSIVIPLAMLTQPYFLRTIPSYIRYATVGLVFSHEILHGFDLSGIGYDSEGTARDWFTPDSRLRLEARLDCVARQYLAAFRKQVNFLGASVDIQFDWNMTRNENMADISGLNIAYQTWQTLRESSANPTDPKLPKVNLNTRQMFFLSAAQSYCSNLTPEDYILLVEMDFHTPYPERVNGMMMNSQPFAEAFNCPLGSPMNPVKKCSIW